MAKKIFSALLAFLLLLASCFSSVLASGSVEIQSINAESAIVGASSGECGTSVKWALSDGGILTISGTGKMDDFYTVDALPWYSYRSQIVSVLIQSGVTSIGSYAFFGCENLKTITLGKDVASVGESSFAACTSLTSIDVHQSNAYFSSYYGVLYSQDRKTLICCPDGKTGAFTVPDTTETIGKLAFEYCSGLTEINVGNGVKTIEAKAFSTCISLEKLVLGDSVATISGDAVIYCEALTSVTVSDGNPNYKSVNGVLYSKDGKTLVCCPCGLSGEYSVPSGVKTIDKYAFYKCNFLTAINISDTVEVINEYAFAECDKLSKVKIGNGVLTIGKNAFADNVSLAVVEMGESVKTIDNYAFFGNVALKEFVLTDSVETVGNYAFSGCYNLKSLKIGSSVTDVKRYSFYRCNSLKSVTIPSTVTTIGYRAFGYVQDNSYYQVPMSGFTIYAYSGTAAAEYASKHGFTLLDPIPEPEPTPVPVPTPDPIISDPQSDYYMDAENLLMPNIVAKTFVSTLLENLGNAGVSATVTDKNGNAVSDTKQVGTGFVVTDGDGTEYEVVVLGDVDGSGAVDATDYLQIKKVFLSQATLEGVYRLASDADGDGNITSTDYLKIKSYFLGKIDLYA